MSLLSQNSKEEMNGDCFVSLGKLFQVLIVDGKKELISLCERSVDCSKMFLE